MESHSDLIGKRLQHKHNIGSIRYLDKLINNPKAGDDLWLGIEWDQEGAGKHSGTVDGVQYFNCQFHIHSPLYQSGETKCCSFLRYGKIQIGGVTLQEALKQKYEQEDQQQDQEQVYVNTDKKGMKKIEILGADQSYYWRSDVKQSYEIMLDFMKISDLGPKGTLATLIPNTMYLYLDKNLLHSWDQYFQITRELRYLNTLTLSANKLQRITPQYMQNKKVEEMINPFLTELVLIDMSLDWEQINILAPTMIYIEQLHLVRNDCNIICSKYEISKDNFKNLKFINLEQNNIESWDEIVGFRNLPVLKRITVTKNKIKEIYCKPGFNDLYVIAFEDNLINNWNSFDALNQFKQIKYVRCHGNPIVENQDKKELIQPRQQIIARLQFLKNLNGSDIEESERRDSELFYLKKAYQKFLIENNIQEQLEDIFDQRIGKFMQENHPRWYELVEIYGSPLDQVNLKSDQQNLASTQAKIKLSSNGKVIEKKFLMTMTVSSLKAVCAKLFKIEVIKQKLIYQEEGWDQEYELDGDLRQLSFFCVRDGGLVLVQEK